MAARLISRHVNSIFSSILLFQLSVWTTLKLINSIPFYPLGRLTNWASWNSFENIIELLLLISYDACRRHDEKFLIKYFQLYNTTFPTTFQSIPLRNCFVQSTDKKASAIWAEEKVANNFFIGIFYVKMFVLHCGFLTTLSDRITNESPKQNGMNAHVYIDVINPKFCVTITDQDVLNDYRLHKKSRITKFCVRIEEQQIHKEFAEASRCFAPDTFQSQLAFMCWARIYLKRTWHVYDSNTFK